MIRNNNVVGPNIKMPFFIAQYAAHHRAAMDADAHIQIDLCVDI